MTNDERAQTGFDCDLEDLMTDPEWRAGYEARRTAMAARSKPLRRDADGELIAVEPLFIYMSEAPGRGERTVRGGGDQWRCREHPEWRGMDFEPRDLTAPDAPTREEFERWSVEWHYLTQHGGPER